MSDDVVTGSFPGQASMVLDVPSTLAAGCATRGGPKVLTVTGTLSLGPACGRVGSRISIYPIGATVICGANDYDPTSITTGPDGALWFVDHGANTLGRVVTP